MQYFIYNFLSLINAILALIIAPSNYSTTLIKFSPVIETKFIFGVQPFACPKNIKSSYEFTCTAIIIVYTSVLYTHQFCFIYLLKLKPQFL